MEMEKAMRFLLTLLFLLVPSLSQAETITFEADSEIMIVRGLQSGDDAKYEILGTSDGNILCVALDGDGQAVAVDKSYAELGFVRFNEIDITAIDKVICRYN